MITRPKYTGAILLIEAFHGVLNLKPSMCHELQKTLAVLYSVVATAMPTPATLETLCSLKTYATLCRKHYSLLHGVGVWMVLHSAAVCPLAV